MPDPSHANKKATRFRVAFFAACRRDLNLGLAVSFYVVILSEGRSPKSKDLLM